LFDDPQLYLFSLALIAALYWIIPSKKWRLSFLISASFLLLFIFYPLALPVALAMTLIAWYGGNLLGSGRLKNVWIVIGLLVAIFVGARITALNSNLLVDIGLTFVLLKSTGAVFEAKKKKQTYSLKNLLLLNFTFPMYPSGPIELVHTVNEDQFADRIHLKEIGEALYRIVIGLVKVVFVVDLLIGNYISALLGAGGPADLSMGDSWLYTYTKFLTVYLNFSGVTDIVIGTGMLFGIRFAENFNLPIIATNIQEFWKRWHMSLGRWINRYLFNILVRNTGKIVFSLMVTFGLVGAWHAFTINYVIWGVAHGVGLSYVYRLNKKRPGWHKAVADKLWYKVAACITTVTYVAVLSTFANTTSLSEGSAFVANLVGM